MVNTCRRNMGQEGEQSMTQREIQEMAKDVVKAGWGSD